MFAPRVVFVSVVSAMACLLAVPVKAQKCESLFNIDVPVAPSHGRYHDFLVQAGYIGDASPRSRAALLRMTDNQKREHIDILSEAINMNIRVGRPLNTTIVDGKIQNFRNPIAATWNAENRLGRILSYDEGLAVERAALQAEVGQRERSVLVSTLQNARFSAREIEIILNPSIPAKLSTRMMARIRGMDGKLETTTVALRVTDDVLPELIVASESGRTLSKTPVAQLQRMEVLDFAYTSKEADLMAVESHKSRLGLLGISRYDHVRSVLALVEEGRVSFYHLSPSGKPEHLASVEVPLGEVSLRDVFIATRAH